MSAVHKRPLDNSVQVSVAVAVICGCAALAVAFVRHIDQMQRSAVVTPAAASRSCPAPTETSVVEITVRLHNGELVATCRHAPLRRT